MPADPRVYYKSCTPEVMFLAVTAKPRDEYDFDGNVGIWPFTLMRKAKRSDTRKGTVARESDILETVTVTAKEYRKVMLRMDEVFDNMLEVM